MKFWILVIVFLFFETAAYSRLKDSVSIDEQTIVIRVEKIPRVFDPQKAETIEEYFLARQGFETLVQIDQNGAIVPGLAKTWIWDQDSKILTLNLREDCFFSDGTLLDSSHVEAMIYRTTQTKLSEGFDSVLGALDFKKGIAPSISGIKKPSKHSIQLLLDEPNASILERLSDVRTGIGKFSKDGSFVGSGWYQKKELQNNKILLSINKLHQGLIPEFKNVVITESTDGPVDIDLVHSSEAQNMRALTYFDLTVGFIGFNSTNPELKDLSVRSKILDIINSSLDSGDLKIRNGVESFIPVGLPGYEFVKLALPKNDTAKLPKEIKITYLRGSFARYADQICLALGAKGVSCSTQTVSPEALFEAKRNNKLQVFLMYFKPTCLSAKELLVIFTSKSRLNFFTSSSPNDKIAKYFNMLFSKIETFHVSESSVWIEAVKTLDRAVRMNVLVKPLFYGLDKKFFISNRIIPFTLSPLGIFDLEIASIKSSDAGKN